MVKKIFIKASFLALIIFIACTPEKDPINYGKENCHYCNMTIVDERYGSEVVTNKGKVYKFDAVECMINFLNEGKVKSNDVAMKLVNSYDNPGKLTPASKNYYLRSKELPSPMGLFITPFTKKAKAESAKQENGGKIYSWKALNTNFEQFSKSIKE